jgi:hypothetical protein
LIAGRSWSQRTRPRRHSQTTCSARCACCDCNRGRTALCGAQPIPWDGPLDVPVQVTPMVPYYGNLYLSIDWLLLPRSSLPGCMRTRTSRRGTLRRQSRDTQTSRSRSLMTRSPAEESSCLPCRTPPSNACPATLRTAQVSRARDALACSMCSETVLSHGESEGDVGLGLRQNENGVISRIQSFNCDCCCDNPCMLQLSP